MENCSILSKTPRMEFQYQQKHELRAFNNFSKDFLFSIFALSKSLVTLHVVLRNFVWCQADSLCVTQLCPHLAEKCKLRIKTKHGKIYLGKTTDFRRVEYIQREHWHKMNSWTFVDVCKNQIHVPFERQMCWFYIAQPLSRKTCYHDLLWFLRRDVLLFWASRNFSI